MMDYLFIFLWGAICTFIQDYFEDKRSAFFWFVFGWFGGMLCLAGAAFISKVAP